jgi:hypothetical protein
MSTYYSLFARTSSGRVGRRPTGRAGRSARCLLLGAVSPEVIADARRLGADAAEITSAVLKLLGGLTRG